jgi:hypothetical protein
VILISVVNRGGVWGVLVKGWLGERSVSRATPDPGRALVVCA